MVAAWQNQFCQEGFPEFIEAYTIEATEVVWKTVGKVKVKTFQKVPMIVRVRFVLRALDENQCINLGTELSWGEERKFYLRHFYNERCTT